MRIWIWAALAPCLLAATAAVATRSDAADRLHAGSSAAADTLVMHVSGAAIEGALQALTTSRASADIARDLPTGDLTRYGFVVMRRRATDKPELHEGWSDVVVVHSGRAVLRTGRTLIERRSVNRGEWTGKDIDGAHEQAVGAGDVIVIPAGLAHQWNPAGAEPFTYLLLKVRPGAAK
jgi:uncharacterized RmlC-like cupin family protein